MKVACDRCGRPTETSPCEKCRVELRADTTNPYNRAEWRTRSRRFLAANPWCAHPRHEGKKVAATIADHYPRSRKRLLDAGVADPDNDEFLRPLCAPCHRREGSPDRVRWINDPA